MKEVVLNKDKRVKVNNQMAYFLNPDFVYLPYSRNEFELDRRIYKNDVIKEDGLNIVSPVSGVSCGVLKYNSGYYIKLANDFRELANKNNPKKTVVTIEIIKYYLEHTNKLDVLKKFTQFESIDNIIVSAINDNPYVYNRMFLLKEKINEVLELFSELATQYKCKNNYLVMKSNESFMIDECLNVIGTFPNIKVTLVNDEYLLEREEYIKKLLEVSANTLYLTVDELIDIYNYLYGVDNTTTLITISGDALVNGVVLRVKKYTLLKDILKKFVEFNTEKRIFIVNGLMAGYEIKDVNEFVITDDVYSINIMKRKGIKERNCINCGKCIDVCPVGVNPLTLKNMDKCIDCGLCSYICPVNINLRRFLVGGKDE